jgi:hypothetical protein
MTTECAEQAQRGSICRAVGQITFAEAAGIAGCQALSEKIFGFTELQISIISIPSCPTERGARDRHDAGQDAMDADGAEDVRHRMRTAKSYGPDTSKVGVKPA